MPADDELTLMLRAGFDAATRHLDASPALAARVRDRHRVAQRRRLAAGVALPAAATAVATVLVLGGGHTPSRAPVGAPSTAQSGATPAPRIKPVSYRLVLPVGSPAGCSSGLGPVGRTPDP